MHLSEHLASPSVATLGNSSELDCTRLSPHFTLGELCKSRHAEIYNIPSHVAIENLKRVCEWLEELRRRYNQQYVCGSFSPPEFFAEQSGKAERGGVRGGLNSGIYSASSDHPAHTGTPPNLGGEKDTPIIINSGYRSPKLNKKVGGSPTSNHLMGCAVDIRVYGIEQAMRYAVILMDYADETRQDYDELLIERNKNGGYWLHFAVRPRDNRRKTSFILKA